jgi:hypothetical protein
MEIAPLQPRVLDINPVISPWLLFLGAVIAATSVLYLYSAQQKIAHRSIVAALTTIRIVLVLMVIALLLGPVRQWVHTRHSNGSLFILVDQSLSMQNKDPQATDRERLAWAAALGYLPKDLQPGSVDVDVNRLVALRDDLDHFRSDADQQQPFATHLADWNKNLDAVATDLEPDPQVKRLAPDVPAFLHTTADTAGKNIVLVRSDPRHNPWGWIRIIGAFLAVVGFIYFIASRRRFTSPFLISAVPAICMALALLAIGLVCWAALKWPDTTAAADVFSVADNAEIPWQNLHDNLVKAISQITPAADASDRDFLSRHGNDPLVLEALKKVKQMARADLAYAALTGNSSRGLKSLSEMLARDDVKIIPFGDHTGISTPAKDDIASSLHAILTNPKQQCTDIADALKFASQQIGEDSSVLLISDGRQNIGSEPEIPARFLASRGTRVFTLTLGSHQLACDAAVDHVDSPDWVYAEDEVVISPVIRLDALKYRNVTVQLQRDGKVVDTRIIRAKTDQEKMRLRLTDHPPGEGLYRYSVVILPVPNEAVTDNNQQDVRVAVKKDKINVLIVEDEPGWEYQFLRNYLARDHRVKLQVVLLSPGHIEQVQAPPPVMASPTRDDGKIDADILPATREQWSAFDIVILGDVPPESIPQDQQKNLFGALRDGGVKALLLIAGQRNMPMRYAGTPLADAIPVELSGSKWTPQELTDQLRHGFIPTEAPDGTGSILGQFSDDLGTNGQIWANLPLCFWHSEQTTARPGASVIWSIQDAVAAPAAKDAMDAYQTTRQHALLTTMNVGLGRVMYLASPQTWRLRYVQTPGDDSHIEDVHRRFWGQVMRWAVGNDLPAGGRFVRFGANKRSYGGGEPILITARVLNEAFTPLSGARFKIIATRSDSSQAGEISMIEAPSEGAGIYHGTMTLPAGSFTLAVHGGDAERLLANDTTVDPSQKTLAIDIAADTSVEDRDVNADPDRMASIAKAGSGIAMDGSYFDVLANHLPVVDHVETQVVQAGLFSNPDDLRTKITHWVFFGVFVSLITAEWILRKRGGLV